MTHTAWAAATDEQDEGPDDDPRARSGVRAGARAGIPYGLASLLLGFSFGGVARAVVGPGAALVMSVVVSAGSAQFAALAVLSAGGGAGAAIAAGILLNL